MSEKRWYVIQTYSGQEYSVKAELEARIINFGQQDYIFNVVIPEEEYTETKKDGTIVTKRRELYSGYVFLEMIITEKSWFIVRNTPRVTGFLGSSGKGALPIPLSAEEAASMLRKLNILDGTDELDIQAGDKVTIISGGFKDKVAEVSAINTEKKTVTVLLEVFGRVTPTEFDYSEVEKLN